MQSWNRKAQPCWGCTSTSHYSKEGFLTESPWVLGVQRHFMSWGPPWALQDVWQQLGLYRKNASTIPLLETVKMCPRSATCSSLVGSTCHPQEESQDNPILAGSELPRHQHSPKCYVPGHHYPSPSRVREVSTEIASRKGRDLGGKAR